MFLLTLISTVLMSQAQTPVCQSEYYNSLHYDLRCVACGVQQMNAAAALPAPGWLTLLSLVSQKYHLGEETKDVDMRKKSLIQLVSTYGVCFTPEFRVDNQPNYWERMTAGYRPVSSISSDDKENEFWNSFGLRYDNEGLLGTLFGCNEEKGCESGLEYFFKEDGEDWSRMNPRERQHRFKQKLAERFSSEVITQGPIATCMNQVDTQLSLTQDTQEGAFNLSGSAENVQNIGFCEGLAQSCGVDKGFCRNEWKQSYAPRAKEMRQPASE